MNDVMTLIYSVHLDCVNSLSAVLFHGDLNYTGVNRSYGSSAGTNQRLGTLSAVTQKHDRFGLCEVL